MTPQLTEYAALLTTVALDVGEGAWKMLAQWLAVGSGGFVGALLRYGVTVAIPRRAGEFPWATFWVNVVGCLLIGVILAWAEQTRLAPTTRAFVVTGLLGALTTFSTFGFESVALVKEGSVGLALANVLGNVVIGGVAVVLGWWGGSWIHE